MPGGVLMLAWLPLELARLRRRLLWLLAFGALFIAAAATARLFGGHDGQVEFDAIMQVGGYPMLSALLLAGWVVGRFPAIAAVVLLAGTHSEPRQSGLARLLEVRARHPLRLLALRALLALLLASALALTVLIAFDVVMLGRAPGRQLFVLVLGHVLTYGALTALLSTLTRADGWAAAFVIVVAMIWQALLRSGALATSPPGIREVVTVLLPPQGALLQLENAFAGDLAVPWNALLYAAIYAALALLIAGIIARRREI
jgi:VanZ family protein